MSDLSESFTIHFSADGNKQREEDEEAKLRIDQLRNLHRNVFMRHVHIELGKIWEKKDS